MADLKTQSDTPPGFFQSVYDGLVLGDLSPNDSGVKTGTQIASSIMPIFGQVADARDTYAAFGEVRRGREGGWGNLAFALIGWVPAAGDFAKSVHKVGFRETMSSIGDAFGSIQKSWSSLWKNTDEKAGEARGLWYHPATDMSSPDLDSSTLGVTNRFGDIRLQEGLSPLKQQSTLDHELVHRFFSPKLMFGQEFRANLGLLGYAESHLLRRVEEGLAEGWAQFQKKGFAGIAEGWGFPLRGGYGIDPERVKIERNILIGATSSTIGAGLELGDQIAEGE